MSSATLLHFSTFIKWAISSFFPSSLARFTFRPGSLGLDVGELTAEVASIASRNARLRDDVSVPLDDLAAVRRLLVKNPIHYWGLSRTNAFRLDGDRWVCTVPLDGGLRDAFIALMDELVEWRLAEYLTRGAEGDFILKVSQTGSGTPMLFINRNAQPGLPEGWTRLLVDGKACEGNFVKVAFNVVREDESGANILPRILRSWFGADAGAAGTLHRVTLRADGEGLRMEPAAAKLTGWDAYRLAWPQRPADGVARRPPPCYSVCVGLPTLKSVRLGPRRSSKGFRFFDGLGAASQRAG